MDKLKERKTNLAVTVEQWSLAILVLSALNCTFGL